METSDIQLQPLRASKMSRLPGPAVHAGLSELSESQHNTRVQTSIPVPPGFKSNLKREIPQPAQQSDAKRKPLSDRAVEYPASASASAAGKLALKGQTLPQLKRPSRQTTNTTASSLNSFAKSFGPGRHQPDRSHHASSRSSHARSKSQVARPRTAHGHRPEDDFDEPTSSNAWDVDGRVDSMESQFKELKNMVNTTLVERKGHEDALEIAKTRVSELEDYRQRLEERNDILKADLDTAKDEVRHAQYELEKLQWQQTRDMDDMNRRHRETVDDLSRQHRTAIEDLSKELDQLKDEETKEHQARIDGLNRHYQQELEEERQKKERAIQDLRSRMGNEQQDLNLELQRKDREIRDARLECDNLRDDLERERSLKGSLQTNITELSAANTTLEAKINSLRSHVEFLESDSKAQSDSFASMEARLQEALAAAEEARQKLIKEETERRVLFNKYQELKGNIRVMCRVRPSITDDGSEEAGISFPDEKTSAEIVLAGPEEKSSLGVVSRKNYPFEFDRVFAPAVQNDEIFGEISQLVQSALDGYNVCIFCYGQTGSGKTYTMSSEDGMIPRATHMIYDTMTKLREKSWEYTMEGSFVEVYNEELNDLLTPNDRSGEGRSKRLEIRHDESRKQTTIVNCKTVQLNSASSVERILEEAQKNRSVAATKANERSSRSHSVFILKLVGENMATGERCEGTLNLVDLAGSERLKHSQAEGDRMRETQNINKSLSCLGDVIEALGRGSGHIPYRNSKLTHLLQYSLGGNSKTLMFVMVSPMETHLKETLTSLRFATKVHNTHIGTAKATKKIRGSE
ncbi:kinesin motor domain-containing protein [Pochonia chlamydosporia 170]|uniref:Kinesin-like protein n=1 Tax=Pochonia chlamydosporia 170 TaxID=1380566 RepID=A0A179FMK3_METCM|nr:kinesin motor domain-containing protein [Pochonia chlamydosporia 170]OAQ66303.2 kinesin motor domain-containing protein [Pochonia chlamydosporia 170]